jgi:hypothetical protein
MSINTLMSVKVLLILPLLFLLGCKTAQNLPTQDEAIAKNLVGSWVNSPVNDQPVYTETTFRADGTGEELVWPKSGSKTNAIQLQTLWMVKGGVITVFHLRSSDPKAMPEGRGMKDKILSMSQDQFTYQPYEGYIPAARRELIKLRKGYATNAAR